MIRIGYSPRIFSDEQLDEVHRFLHSSHIGESMSRTADKAIATARGLLDDVVAERAATRAIRKLHVEQIRYSYDDGETSYDSPEDGNEYTTFSVCAECGRIEIREGESADVSEGLTYHESLWPCATIKELNAVQGPPPASATSRRSVTHG